MVEVNHNLSDINIDILGKLASKPVLLGIGIFVSVFIFLDWMLFALGLGGIFYRNTKGITPQQFFENELGGAWDMIKQGWQQMQQGWQQFWNALVNILRGGGSGE